MSENSNTNVPGGGKTGIFYVKDPAGVVVMKSGKEIARYDTVQAFVASHEEGLQAISNRDEKLHEAIFGQYAPNLTDS
jgi:hypothetical protein